MVPRRNGHREVKGWRYTLEQGQGTWGWAPASSSLSFSTILNTPLLELGRKLPLRRRRGKEVVVRILQNAPCPSHSIREAGPGQEHPRPLFKLPWVLGWPREAERGPWDLFPCDSSLPLDPTHLSASLWPAGEVLRYRHSALVP